MDPKGSMASQSGSGRAVMPMDFQSLFEKSPGRYLVLDPHFLIVAANDAYCAATMTRREEIVGRTLFEAFPDNPDGLRADGVSNLRSSLLNVLKTRQADAMAPQKHGVRKPASEGGGFEPRYWSPLNTPILGADGYVRWIIHSVEDITELMKLKASLGRK
jgi:PAS domain-containing protein